MDKFYKNLEKTMDEMTSKNHWTNNTTYGVYMGVDDDDDGELLFTCKTEDLAKGKVVELKKLHGQMFYYKKL